MAHHRSTPRTVLDAPQRTVVQTHTPQGATRHERRHGVDVSGLALKPKGIAKYLRTLRVPNAPAVRATPRRGRKVRRGRAS